MAGRIASKMGMGQLACAWVRVVGTSTQSPESDVVAPHRRLGRVIWRFGTAEAVPSHVHERDARAYIANSRFLSAKARSE